MRLYLAGPEVFLPNAVAVGARKKQICARHGLTGVFPLDNEIPVAGLSPYGVGMAIYRGNIGLLKGCDLVIANVTPFRGPGADPGTAFEMGYMAALCRPLFAYSNSPRSFAERVTQWQGPVMVREDGTLADRRNLAIEQFGMPDNLMLAGAAEDLGCPIFLPETPEDLPLEDLSVFAKCVEAIARNHAP